MRVNALIKFFLILAIPTSIYLGFSCTKQFLEKDDARPLNLARSTVNETTLLALEKDFRKINSGVKSTIIELNNDQVINSLTSGIADIYVGKIIIPKALEASIKKIPIAKDGVVLIVNKNNPVHNLSKKDLVKVFTGAISNWKELGGENKPIIIADRKIGSIERRTFEKLVFDDHGPQTLRSVTVDTIAEVKNTLHKFPNVISYINYSELHDDFKVLSLDRIPATAANIGQGYFPLATELYLYYNPELLVDSAKYHAVKEFVQLAHSLKGQEILSENGLIPLSEAELKIASLNNEPLYIGLAAPKQDTYMDLGRSIVNGAKLALAEHEIDGMAGRPIELKICDDGGNTRGAVECATKFVEDNVIGVIGHLNSQPSIEASKIYAKNSIVQITPAATHPWFTERPDSKGFVFRTCGRDDQQAKLISNAIKELPIAHPLKVSVFNNGTVYGSTLSALVEDYITKYGVDKVIDIKSIKRGQQQYFNELEGLKSQVLVFIGEYGDAASLIKGLVLNNKSDVVFFGSDGVYSQQLIEEAGLRAEGAYTVGSALNPNSIVLKDLCEKYKETFKMESNAFAMNSYDATKILLKAIEKSNVKHPSLVAKEVKEINYQGVTGAISFDEKGDPVLPRIALYKVTNGIFVKQ